MYRVFSLSVSEATDESRLINRSCLAMTRCDICFKTRLDSDLLDLAFNDLALRLSILGTLTVHPLGPTSSLQHVHFSSLSRSRSSIAHGMCPKSLLIIVSQSLAIIKRNLI